MAQSAAQGFYLALIGVALALERLERLQHLFHVFQALAKGVHDIVYLLDRVLNAGLGSRLKISRGSMGRVMRSGFWFGRAFNGRLMLGGLNWLIHIVSRLEGRLQFIRANLSGRFFLGLRSSLGLLHLFPSAASTATASP